MCLWNIIGKTWGGGGAIDIWVIERIWLNLQWNKKKPNGEILVPAGIKRLLIKTIRERQIKCNWHNLAHPANTSEIDGRKYRERDRD